MYNFKSIDYRLSKQEYVFSFLSIFEKTKYDFIYIPYSEFPALLMLDYIMATRPEEFNADIFNYFKDAVRSEKFGDKDILIISDRIVSRNSHVNQLGIFKKDVYYLGQIVDQINQGKRHDLNIGSILKSAQVGGVRQKEGKAIIGNNFLFYLDGRCVDVDTLFSSKKGDSLGVIEDVRFGKRFYEIAANLVGLFSFEKDVLSTALAVDFPVERINYTFGIISETDVAEINHRGANFITVLSLDNYSDAVVHDDVSALRLDEYNSVFSEDSVKGIRIDSFKTYLANYIQAERLSYIKYSSIFEIELLEKDSRLSSLTDYLIDSTKVVEFEYTTCNFAGRETFDEGIIKDIVLSGIGSYREGIEESLIDATKPRKKLLKSWLGDWRREKKEKIIFDLDIQGVGDISKRLKKYNIDLYKRDVVLDLVKSGLDLYKRDKGKDLTVNSDLASADIKRRNRLDRTVSQLEGNIFRLRDMESTAVLDGIRDKQKPLLKFELGNFDFGKDVAIEENEFFDKYKEAVIEKQKIGQSLMYDYSNILEEGMEVEHWKVGYAIPEHYDPKDPFNPYYPWAEERNKYSLVQEEEWEQLQGAWELDRSNAEIKSLEGGGLLLTKKLYGDFKFSFNVQLGYEPDDRVGFVFRYKDANNYYKITLSSGSNPIELVQLIDGQERKVAMPIAPFYMSGGSWHNIDISHLEDRLTVYVDGRLQYDLVLES